MGGGEPGQQHGQPQQQRRGPQPPLPDRAPARSVLRRGLGIPLASGAGVTAIGRPRGGIRTCAGSLPCAWRGRAVLLGIHANRYSAPPGRPHDP